MFGDWILPQLAQNYYCIAIDTIGDLGRSRPKDGDPANGPKTEQEVAEWAVQVFDTVVQNNRKVHVLGYSLGSFLASCVARYRPDHVEKVVLMAPAGTFAPVRFVWLAGAIGMGLLSALLPFLGDSLRMKFVRYMMVDPDTNMANLKRMDLLQAASDLGMSKVNIQPRPLDVDELHKMNEQCPTLLIIGQQETVIDANVAIETAKKANIQVKVYKDAGHMMDCEPPARDAVAGDIERFLSEDSQ
ncbi:MAG: hypothetical protein SGILL_009148 [Bacillariaceae sp.]